MRSEYEPHHRQTKTGLKIDLLPTRIKEGNTQWWIYKENFGPSPPPRVHFHRVLENFGAPS